MDASLLLLTLGVLLALWDQAFGVPNWPEGKQSLRKRFASARKERLCTIGGSTLILASVVLQALGH